MECNTLLEKKELRVKANKSTKKIISIMHVFEASFFLLNMVIKNKRKNTILSMAINSPILKPSAELSTEFISTFEPNNGFSKYGLSMMLVTKGEVTIQPNNKSTGLTNSVRNTTINAIPVFID